MDPHRARPASCVSRGITAGERSIAARLYLEAFSRKLLPAVPDSDQLQLVVADALRREQLLAARDPDTGDLLGVCGVVDDGRPAVDVGWELLRRHLGRAPAARALVALAPLGRRAPAGVLLLDGLAVDPAARGRGHGTALLDAATELAREWGCHAVRLSVVDSNSRAARLYEHRGFRTVAHGGLGPFAAIYGFAGYRVMERSVR